MLHLPIIGLFMELRDLCLNGLRLRSLPINELCCFTNLERFRLDYFNQVIHKMELEIPFVVWRSLRVLLFNKCSKLSEIPDNISALTELEQLSLSGSSVDILPACIQHLSNLREIDLDNCMKLRSILGLPPTLDTFGATNCTSLESIRCSPRFQQQFTNLERFDFRNCAKLDEASLVFIEKLIQGSFILAVKRTGHYSVCYSGSRVPNWIRYMEVASNNVEFTCNSNEQSLIGMLFCCVLPSNRMVMKIYCNCTDGNNLIFKSYYSNPYYAMGNYNPDHVFIWSHNFSQNDDGASYNGKIIACEFSATYEKAGFIDPQVSIIACGVSPVYASKRKRQREAHADDIGYMRKQKNPSICWLSPAGFFQT